MDAEMSQDTSVGKSESLETTIRRLPLEEQQLLLGPDLGLDAYMSYAPKEESQREYALRQITDKFARVADAFSEEASAVDAARQDRQQMWDRYAELKQRIEDSPDANVRDTVIEYLKETNPMAADQLAAFDKGLGLHLKEVEDFSASFLLTPDGTSRFPDTFTDRQAALIADVGAPLHDSLKFLGSFQAQAMPDHEIMIAELIRTSFDGGLVQLQGEESRLTTEDIAFLSGIVGDHENIFKEEGRRDFIHSESAVERGKAAFFVADVLTGVIVPSQQDGTFTIDHVQLSARFADLYFRHIDLEKGKVFRPEWGKSAIQDIVSTVQELQNQGLEFSFEQSDVTFELTLTACAVGVIDKALAADRVLSALGEGMFTSRQLDRIESSRQALEALV